MSRISLSVREFGKMHRKLGAMTKQKKKHDDHLNAHIKRKTIEYSNEIHKIQNDQMQSTHKKKKNHNHNNCHLIVAFIPYHDSDHFPVRIDIELIGHIGYVIIIICKHTI